MRVDGLASTISNDPAFATLEAAMPGLALPPAFANRLLAAASVDASVPDLLPVEALLIALEPRVAERVETRRYHEAMLPTWTDDDPLRNAWLTCLSEYPDSPHGEPLEMRCLELLHGHPGYIAARDAPTSDHALGSSRISLSARR